MGMQVQLPPRCVHCNDYIPPERVERALKRGEKPTFCSSECLVLRAESLRSAHPKGSRWLHTEGATSPQECAWCQTLTERIGVGFVLREKPCKNCGKPISFHKLIEMQARGKEAQHCSAGCNFDFEHRKANRKRAARTTRHTCQAKGRWGNYDETCPRCKELEVAPPSRQALFEQAKRERARES